MPLETASHITDLVSTNPASGDQVAVADDHLRLIKSVLLTDFATINGPITATVAEINSLNGILKTQLDRSGSLTTTNTATAYNLATNTVFASLSAMNGKAIIFKPHVTSGASPTLNVDGLGAVALKSIAGTVIPTGALLVGGRYAVTYNDSATEFVVHGIFGVLPATTFSGAVTVSAGGLTVTAGGMSVAGGLTVSTGGIVVSSNGITVTGNSSITGNLALSGVVGVGTTDHMFPASGTTAQRSGTTEGSVRYNTTLHALEFYDATRWVTALAPTKQYLTSGTSATYTTPAGCRLIIVKMIGGGGGGGALTTNNGGTGGNTVFNSISAVGGSGGQHAAQVGRLGGIGGTGGTSGSFRVPGSTGGAGGSSANNAGGNGAPGIFGTGAGQGGLSGGTSSGTVGASNTGAGGGGASGASNAAGGGGSGEYAEIVIASPAATYTYTVGTAGGAGGAGGTAGSAGGTGMIIVEEYY